MDYQVLQVSVVSNMAYIPNILFCQQFSYFFIQKQNQIFSYLIFKKEILFFERKFLNIKKLSSCCECE